MLPSVRSKQESLVRRSGIVRKGMRSRAGWNGALVILSLLMCVAGGCAGGSDTGGGSRVG